MTELEQLRDELAFITREEVADMLDVSGPRISQLVRDGVFTQDERGRLPRRQTVHDACRWLRSRAGDGKRTAVAARRRSVELDNELKEIALARERREAIPVFQVDKAWAYILLNIRSHLLRLPNKLAPRIPFLGSEAAIEAELLREIEEILALMARPVEYRPDEPADSEAA